MSASFLRDITENIRAAARGAPIDGHIAYAPAGLDHLFDGMLADGTGLVLADGEIDMPAGVDGFGRSLLHATRALAERGYGAVCVLNSDSPTLPTTLLREAALALLSPGERVVLGAAEDGGYYLLGMQAAHADLYREIAWSTETVADQTRARAAGLGLPVLELTEWYDVDDRAALGRLLGDISANGSVPRSPEPYPAPATAACVARLGLSARLAATG